MVEQERVEPSLAGSESDDVGDRAGQRCLGVGAFHGSCGGSLHGHSLRNCSCADEIQVQDCKDALANLLCSCHTVPQSSLPPAGGLHVVGSLTVWVRNPWVLEGLLNGSTVRDLRLSACGSTHLDSHYLALFGLRQLWLHSSAQGATHPEQALTIASGLEGERGADGGISFLDVSLLNGNSSLKAYSVSSPSTTLTQHFPHLSFSPSHLDPQQDCLLTFIY